MKRKYKIAIAVVVVLLIGGLVIWRMSAATPDAQTRTVPVTRATVTQDVSFSGRLAAKQSAELAFEYPGVVQQLQAHVGEAVEAGTLLVQLNTQLTQLEVAAANADQASAQAAAKATVDDATKALKNEVAENNRSLEQQRQQVRDAKTEMEQAYRVWEARVSEEDDGSPLAHTAYASYLSAKSAYTTAQETLKTLQATIKKSNDAAGGALTLAEEKYSATTQASRNTVGLSSLQAAKSLAATKLSKLSLVAPFSGTVTSVDTEVGEYVTPGKTVVALQTVDQLEVVADVTETDATKIAVNMAVDVTFDALGDSSPHPATVTSISPAAKIIEGVPTYEVKIAVPTTDSRLKPGLTADAIVHAQKRDSVLSVPRRALTQKDGGYFVHIKQADQTEQEVRVEIGLTGSDGLVEITQGVQEGQEVIVSVPNES